MNECGQVYVTVEANEAMPMLMSAGGSGDTLHGSFEIRWQKPGGVTSNGGWPFDKSNEEMSTKSVDEINMMITARLEEINELKGNVTDTILSFPRPCWDLHA